MDDSLLAYYNRELNYVRQMGAEFADKHPKIAGRLRLDKDIVEDPHVSRLVESFAFLTARIRQRLDDDFPELTEALMGVMYPDFHAPLPSMSVVQIRLLPQLSQTARLDKGEMLTTKTHSGETVLFRTSSDTVVLPLNVESVRLAALPTKAPPLPNRGPTARAVQSVLKLKLTPNQPGEQFACDENSLKFYLGGNNTIAFRLREFIAQNLQGIAIARDAFDENPLFLGPEKLIASGFSPTDSAIPFDGRTSTAHRLITEFFLLPEKFRFLTLTELSSAWTQYPDGFEVYLYFSDSDIELIKGVNDSSLQLGCVPVVNLFDARGKAIQAAKISDEVRLEADTTTTQVSDVYRVKSVTANNAHGDTKTIKPFYKPSFDEPDDKVRWAVKRRNSSLHKGRVSHGTDTFLNFVDSSFAFIAPDSGWVVNSQLECTNRDLPNKLPFGPNEPKMNFLTGGAGLRIECLLPPTAPVQPELSGISRWQFTAQLSLQHFANKDGLATLRSTLALYNFHNSKEIQSLIDGIVKLESGIVSSRINDQGRWAMCQGTRITLTCDESFYTGNSLYLFGSVLDEFFAQYCTVNSFTQLVIKSQKHISAKFTWEPRAGCQPLI